MPDSYLSNAEIGSSKAGLWNERERKEMVVAVNIEMQYSVVLKN